MGTAIAKQISLRMKIKEFSVEALEKAAGVRRHTVRNILRGGSRRPNAITLQAVSKVLGCTIDDLLGQADNFQEENILELEKTLRSSTYKNTGLLLSVVKHLCDQVTQRNHNFTVHQILLSIEEIYLYSFHKGLETVDEGFTKWFLDLMDG